MTPESRSMPIDGLIVTICPSSSGPSVYCQPPLFGHTLNEDLLIRRDRSFFRGDDSLDPDGYPTLEVFRFVPVIPLVVGDTYELALRGIDGTVASAVTSFVVVEASATPPPLPVVNALEYVQAPGFERAVRVATFRLEQVSGILVADVGEPEESPWQNVSLRFTDRDEQGVFYRLGIDDCDANFWQADLGVTTKVRFGQLDAAGRFSGWTPDYLVSYPETENEGMPLPGEVVMLDVEGVPYTNENDEPEGDVNVAPVDDLAPVDDVSSLPDGVNSSSGCSLSGPSAGAGSLPWLFALCALYASRWLGSAASGLTSSRKRRSSVAGEPG
jgi:hypothetical protein